jgi:F0F1-type ATP synthase delta subunit
LCFAEHKYTDRDICTIVVNDLLVKKTIKYDFRKIINDKEITNNEKVKILDNEYKNDFEQLDIFLQQYDLDKEEKILDNIKKQFIKIIKTHIIFYDPLQ